MAPYMSSVGPSEGIEIGVVEFRLMNNTGGDRKRGEVVSSDDSSLDPDTGRFNAFDQAGATDVLGNLLGVLLEDIPAGAYGRVRFQGRVKHVLLGGTVTRGALAAPAASTYGVTVTTGLSKRKITFKAETGGGSGEYVAGIWDGWSGFGKDEV